jgi:hypothetical protein
MKKEILEIEQESKTAGKEEVVFETTKREIDGRYSFLVYIKSALTHSLSLHHPPPPRQQIQ